MLILTRKPNEKFYLNDDIVIEILSISGRQVRVGVTAPKDVVVLRHEIYQRYAASPLKVIGNQLNKEPWVASALQP